MITPLREKYLAYLDCLNRQAWDELSNFVSDNAHHNGRPFGLTGYRQMLIRDFKDIPDLQFRPTLIVCEPPFVAARLEFTCTPAGDFLGLQIDGQTITFSEHVTYEFEDGKIVRVWSILDKLAIEKQIAIRSP